MISRKSDLHSSGSGDFWSRRHQLPAALDFHGDMDGPLEGSREGGSRGACEEAATSCEAAPGVTQAVSTVKNRQRRQRGALQRCVNLMRARPERRRALFLAGHVKVQRRNQKLVSPVASIEA